MVTGTAGPHRILRQDPTLQAPASARPRDGRFVLPDSSSPVVPSAEPAGPESASSTKTTSSTTRECTVSLRVICFDLGGVIIRTAGSWEECCENAGLPYRPQVDSPEIQVRIRSLDQAHQLGSIPDDDFFAGISRATGGLYRTDEIERLHDAWLRGEYPGMEEIILDLNRSERVRTACLSNTNHRHWDLMEGTRPSLLSPATQNGYPAFRALSHRCASHIFGLAKPSPEVFRRFALELGTTPGEILLFDDRSDNVETARSEGWEAEIIDTAAGPAGQVREALRKRLLG
jgi:FMN phosphatase YigB (HAD superfamily)